MAVNVLVSYGVLPQVDVAAVRASLPPCGHLLIDSGAYTAYTTGKRISVAAYAAFLERWRGSWDHAITLDVVRDPTASARNTRLLHARGLPVMPVFTAGASLAEFDAMAADSGYVAVGGLVGAKRNPRVNRERLAMLQRRAAEQGGGIHALGVGSVPTLRVARPYSADSSLPSASLAQGNVMWFDGRRFHASIRARYGAELAPHRDTITAFGIDLAMILRARRLPSAGAAAADSQAAMLVAMAWADASLREALGYFLATASMVGLGPRAAAEAGGLR